MEKCCNKNSSSCEMSASPGTTQHPLGPSIIPCTLVWCGWWEMGPPHGGKKELAEVAVLKNTAQQALWAALPLGPVKLIERLATVQNEVTRHQRSWLVHKKVASHPQASEENLCQHHQFPGDIGTSRSLRIAGLGSQIRPAGLKAGGIYWALRLSSYRKNLFKTLQEKVRWESKDVKMVEAGCKKTPAGVQRQGGESSPCLSCVHYHDITTEGSSPWQPPPQVLCSNQAKLK